MKILIFTFIFLIEFKALCQRKPVESPPLYHRIDTTEQAITVGQLQVLPAQVSVNLNQEDTLYYFSFENNSAEGFLPVFQYLDQNIRWHRKKLGELFPTYLNTRFDEGTVTAINESEELTRLEMISPVLKISPTSDIAGFGYKIFVRQEIFNFENSISYPARITLAFEDNGLKYDYFLSHHSPMVFEILLSQEIDGQSWINRPFRLIFHFISKEKGEFWCIKDIKILKVRLNHSSHLTTGSGTTGPSGPR